MRVPGRYWKWKGSGICMKIVRYLNGKRLHGVMPPLLLDAEGVGALLSDTRARQDLPLPAAGASAILNAEDGGFGKEEAWTN